MPRTVLENSSGRGLRLVGVLFIAVVAAALVFAVGDLLVNGAMAQNKKEIVAALVVALVPLMLYAALTKPFVFPFCLYVLLVPFDNLLGLDPRYGTVTKLVAICAGASLIFSLIRNRRIVTPDKVMFIWLALLVLMSLSVFWAIDPVTAVRQLVTYAELILLYIVLSVFPVTPKEFRVLAAAVVLGGLVSAVSAIYLFHSGTDLSKAELGGQLTSRVIIKAAQGKGEPKIDPNDFGAALMFPIALVLMSTLRRRWSLTKLALGGLLLLLLGGVYVTGSRGALVALGTLMMYLIWRSRYRAQVIFFSVVGLATVLVLTNPFARFQDALQTGGSGRLSIWKVGFEAFKHHWLIGAGVGNFPFAYDQSFMSIYESIYAYWHRVAHNMPLTLAVELGIGGLTLGMLGWYLQFRTLNFLNASDPLYDLRISLESGMVGLFVASMFLSDLGDKYVWVGFMLLAAARSLALGRARQDLSPPLVLTTVNVRDTLNVQTKVPEHA